MIKILSQYLFGLFLFASIGYSQTVVPISQLKVNGSNGLPADTGLMFAVRGVVTCGNQFGAAGPGAVQDATGAISVYGSTFAGGTQIGDSVTVYAKLAPFNGLTQLDMRATGSTLTKHGVGVPVLPQVVTIRQITNQAWNGLEDLESRLLRVNNVTISGTGNFVGNANYNMTDTSGTGQLRIDVDVTSIVGTAIPSGTVDIIGILGQYKTSAPYNSGYQLIPRFILDIVNDGSPVILNPVLVLNLQPVSFDVTYQTARKGNTKIKWGKTTALELDSLIDNRDTTNHKISLSGLLPSTTYYFKVYSTNVAGTSESSLQTAITAAYITGDKRINVYFNYPVDTTVAIAGNSAKGSVTFSTQLIKRINQAVYSIDMAVYSFNGLDDVVAALLAAKARGVKIRIVYDSRTIQASMQQLISGGLRISQRVNTNGIMHNKFFVFDARDTVASNDWVWTGSWNITDIELTWKNNIVEINDASVAQAYMTEFQEMWGGTADTPNVALAKFGSAKSDNTPHTFNVNNIPLNIYFSPSDGTTAKIIAAINTLNSSMYFAQYSFTRQDIRTAMYNRYQLGVTDFRGIIHDYNGTGSQYTYLQGFTEVFKNASPTLHHKYAIIDATNANSDPKVITGSHNWSTNAETDNDENTLIISDVYIANQYMQEFKKRYNDLGGTGTFIVPIVGIKDNTINAASAELYQNYPNPFNPVTTIRFTNPISQRVRIEVFNTLGQSIGTLFDQDAAPGIYAVDFNAGSLSKAVSSGIYFYRLTAGSFVQSKKMILNK